MHLLVLWVGVCLPGLTVASSQATPAHTECSAPVSKQALVLTPEKISADGLGLTLEVSGDGNELRSVASEMATGSCAGAVKGFVTDRIYLAGDRVLRRGATGAPSFSEEQGSDFSKRRLSAEKGPGGGTGQFTMGYPVAYRQIGGTLVTDYIGIWRVAGGSVVRSFSSRPEGGFTTPRPVLRSNLPLRSVTYFPAPDVPSGQLGLVQEVNGGTVRLIGITWWHSSTFR
ncbi:hypothetical protein FHS95_000333 [Sphingomonas naasensis]|uniref:Uncharacterized protein n=1 Tax=Sphingomonas naasensis TaxID=1344951 RepID=A0A4S1WRB2_9SPHN|nr:hypothetical protein [Sphingomonas naasensis]NIJ18664.1 hypothetical protein [Sphingomonas naasensis]TGX45904.1 hypothetical protein E5A74_01650 [Sphingomonas naasensis]